MKPITHTMGHQFAATSEGRKIEFFFDASLGLDLVASQLNLHFAAMGLSGEPITKDDVLVNWESDGEFGGIVRAGEDWEFEVTEI